MANFFTSNGTWICPSGVYFIDIIASGGGNGGSHAGVALAFGGNGGDGGTQINLNNVPVIPGTTYTITIGLGGVANGGVGGNTTFVGGGLSIVALGGGGPAGGVGGGHGGNGTAGTNTDYFTGGAGGFGSGKAYSGGGGGGAGTLGNGGNGANGPSGNGVTAAANSGAGGGGGAGQGPGIIGGNGGAGGGFWSGGLAEYILYVSPAGRGATPLLLSQITQVNAYLMSKYGI